MTAPTPLFKPVRVWDLPTRAFHWMLAGTVIASIVTAKIGGNAMVWHTRLGLLALALLLFRVVWGFVGGHWSRFASFVFSPSEVMAYFRGHRGPDGPQEAGHSPAGALSVFALLGLLLVQAATGLVADDEIATTGPLNRFVASSLASTATGWHKTAGQYLLFVLIVLHVGAVLYYLLRKEQDLIGPMWHGDKQLPPTATASSDTAGQRALAAVLMGLALALSWWIASLGG